MNFSATTIKYAVIATVSYAVFITGMVSGCSKSNSAGATTETTNGIAITVVDSNLRPMGCTRVSIYDSLTNLMAAKVTDSLGRAKFDDVISGNYVEAIFGDDSSHMSWETFEKIGLVDNVDSTCMILVPAASLTIRSGAATSDSAKLPQSLFFRNTPYTASLNATEYQFAHVPAGFFDVVSNAGDSVVSVKLDAAEKYDMLVNINATLRTLIFENFEDGDNKHTWAKSTGSSGWYITQKNDAEWIKPISTDSLTTAIVSDSSTDGNKFISFKFALGDSGTVSFGTHLGADSLHYDLSAMSAVRIVVRGNAEFDIALENYQEEAAGKYNKALWHSIAVEDWKELVFRTGEELYKPASYEVNWNEVSKGIALFSIFIRSGSWLDIDSIVFEGVDKFDHTLNNN